MTYELWDLITGTTQADYDMFIFILVLIGIALIKNVMTPKVTYVFNPPNNSKP